MIATALLSIQLAAAQQAPAAIAPSASGPVDREFAELGALLHELTVSFGQSRKFCAPDPGSVFAARLALFAQRFGTDPRSASQWAALQAEAQRMLDGVGDAGHPQTGEIQDVPPQMDRYVLLDILGRTDEARKILDSVSTTGGDGCIWCTGENSVVVNQRRSEDAERRGDLPAALRYLHESVLDLPVISGQPPGTLPGEDLLLARYGLLLVHTGHAELGILVLQHLASTRPSSVGGLTAAAELDHRHAVGGTELARFLACQVQGNVACSSCAIIAVWTANDPASMHWIAARLPQRNQTECTRTVAFDPAGFEDARSLLEHRLTTTAFDQSVVSPDVTIDALTLLDGLPGGAERYVDDFLDRVATFKDAKSALAVKIDERLRWMHGGGPRLTKGLGSCDWASLSEDWKRWRKTTGTHATGKG